MQNNIIKADLFRYDLHGTLGFLRGWLIPGFRYMFYFRKAQSSKISFIIFLYRIVLRRLSYKYGFQIPILANIGAGFYIGHHGSVIINANAIIGRNCSVSPGVVIGQDNRGKKKGAPTLGDKVWIGANAVLVGKITIGNDVLITPNTFVNFDVPDHSIVIGNPAKIVPRENATEGFISFVVND